MDITETKLRERTIAKIRGYRKGHRFQDTRTTITSDATWDDKHGEWYWLRDNGFPVTCPQWTTSNNAAWELWIELPDGKCYTQQGDAHYITLHNQEHHMTVKGISFADAVSKAWLRYKEKAMKMTAQADQKAGNQ